MRNLFFLLVGLVLTGNFIILMAYGYAIRSTNLFITAHTVFYPVAWLNLILGILTLGTTIRNWSRQKKGAGPAN
jgi:hypothetical protein